MNSDVVVEINRGLHAEAAEDKDAGVGVETYLGVNGANGSACGFHAYDARGRAEEKLNSRPPSPRHSSLPGQPRADTPSARFWKVQRFGGKFEPDIVANFIITHGHEALGEIRVWRRMFLHCC